MKYFQLTVAGFSGEAVPWKTIFWAMENRESCWTICVRVPKFGRVKSTKLFLVLALTLSLVSEMMAKCRFGCTVADCMHQQGDTGNGSTGSGSASNAYEQSQAAERERIRKHNEQMQRMNAELWNTAQSAARDQQRRNEAADRELAARLAEIDAREAARNASSSNSAGYSSSYNTSAAGGGAPQYTPYHYANETVTHIDGGSGQVLSIYYKSDGNRRASTPHVCDSRCWSSGSGSSAYSTPQPDAAAVELARQEAERQARAREQAELAVRLQRAAEQRARRETQALRAQLGELPALDLPPPEPTTDDLFGTAPAPSYALADELFGLSPKQAPSGSAADDLFDSDTDIQFRVLKSAADDLLADIDQPASDPDASPETPEILHRTAALAPATPWDASGASMTTARYNATQEERRTIAIPTQDLRAATDDLFAPPVAPTVERPRTGSSSFEPERVSAAPVAPIRARPAEVPLVAHSAVEPTPVRDTLGRMADAGKKVADRTAFRLADETITQIRDNQMPDLGGAAKKGIEAEWKDLKSTVQKSIIDSTMEQLPAERQTEVRGWAIPAAWMSLSLEKVKKAYQELVQKDVIDVMEKISPTSKP